MESVCSILGREEICCLTGVRRNNGFRGNGSGPTVYRRPSAFVKAWYVQAPSLGMAFLQILLREHPDVVQIATAHDGYIGLWLRQRLGLPYVIYAHGNEILNALQSEWPKPRQSLRQASRVLAVSRYTAALVERTGVSSERIEILHPGCDIDAFQPCEPDKELRRKFLGDGNRDRVILSVGNLVSRKGHDRVIMAMPRLLKTAGNLKYLIVGDGPHRTELERLASVLGVRERVVFAGKVPDKELPGIYALCEVFVLPSREQLDLCDVEGFGMVFLEANACGKPVVAGRSGGIGDAIVDGQTGFLVEPRDPDCIAATVEKLLANTQLRSQLGEQGRDRVVREFSWPAVATRLRGILQRVVQEKFSSLRVSP